MKASEAREITENNSVSSLEFIFKKIKKASMQGFDSLELDYVSKHVKETLEDLGYSVERDYLHDSTYIEW